MRHPHTIGSLATSLACVALSIPTFAHAAVEFQDSGRLMLVPRATSVGTSIARARTAEIELPAPARSAIEEVFSKALPDCVARASSVKVDAIPAPHGPDSSVAHLEGWGLYLDLPTGLEKGYAGNAIWPFVSVRVTAAFADGSTKTRELSEFEKLKLPGDQRLTVREVEESDPRNLAQLLIPFIGRHAAEWRSGQLSALCAA